MALSEIDGPPSLDYRVEAAGKIGQALLGLDPNFAIPTLPERQQRYLESRFGLLGDPPITQRQMARDLGVSFTTAAHIENRALRRLSDLRRSVTPERPFYLKSPWVEGEFGWSDKPLRKADRQVWDVQWRP